MKLQLKLIAAAALIAVAGSASASIQQGNALAAGGGELVFFAYDATQGKSFQQDLGMIFNNFLPTNASLPNFSASVLGANWTSYLASVGGSLAGTTWGVVGEYKGSGIQVNGQRLMTTVAAGTTAAQLAAQSTNKLATAVAAANANFLALNATNVADANVAVNASYVNAYDFTANVGNNLGSGLTFSNANAIGTAAAFTYFARTTTGALAANTAYNNAFSFNFDGSSISAVTVSAVPEPTTYAMMIAGLMLVGGIARRRNSAK
ncbi:hypothetical protein RCH09_002679 [Actimicrobium sp. GrIS 1.19]|uniref:PEPxxWA-CTERM sorting domain-containing protein n=1 Tax=Actimicrobium sp. GrIS 1.19 TaxID=3071708 RepID=UPI002E08988D|nr:hypothetical protein [Actimicrobium sp. GrIS 1.19]